MESIPNSSKNMQGQKDLTSSQSPKDAIFESSSATATIANVPIASGDTVVSETLNKYVYDEFAGPGGEAYLKSIVKQIIPRALAETWEAAISYQAPGNTCYVSSGRIQRDMKIKARDERTIRKHWQTFRSLQLATFDSTLKPISDERGTRMCAVVEKDFRGLYDLAHEFHGWIESGSYAQVPPDRDNAEAILRNEELARKLVRFECYKRVLINDAPGPKSRCDYAQRIASKLRQKMQAIAAKDTTTAQKNANRNIYLSVYPAEYSQDPKKEDFLKKDRLPNSNGFADLERREAAGARAIGSGEGQAYSNPKDRATTNTYQNECAPPKTEKTQRQEKWPALPPENTEKDGKHRKSTKRALPSEYRAELERVAEQGLPATKLVEELTVRVYAWLNDHAELAYVVNNMKKFFREQLDIEHHEDDPRTTRIILNTFLSRLEYAYALPPEKVQSRNADDQSPNWMPRFRSGLARDLQVAVLKPAAEELEAPQEVPEEENELGRELVEPVEEVVEDDEPCEPVESTPMEAAEPEGEGDIENTSEFAELSDPEVLLASAANYEISISAEGRELIEQRDPEAMAALREQLLLRTIELETDRRRSEAINEAFARIEKVVKVSSPVGMRVQPLELGIDDPCDCGCELTYLAADKCRRCVACDAPWQWSLPVQKAIQVIALKVPNYDSIFDQVADEYIAFADDQSSQSGEGPYDE